MIRIIDIDKWQEIFDSIRRHKLRTFLTALSVWWGIFMLIILWGAGKGLQNSAEHGFKDDAINSIWLRPSQTTLPHRGLPPGRRLKFNEEDYNLLKNEVEGVEHLTGRFYLSGNSNIIYKNKDHNFDIRSVHPAHQFLEKSILVEGRFINEFDIEEERKVCIIGDLVKEAIFEKEDALGKYIRIKNVDFQVVGIYTDEGHEREREKVYLPITTSQKAFSTGSEIHQLIFTMNTTSLAESQEIEQAVRSKMAIRHKFDIKDRNAISIRNLFENYNEFQTVFSFIQGFIWFVGIGSIIAGVIGISNIMLIVVKDRTREIGVRKAIGATPYSIISMIVQEAILITSVAGYIGMITGVGLIYTIRSIMDKYKIETEFFRDPEVNFSVVLTALVLLILSGAIAGLIPAIQASRIHPVKAMKS